MRFTSEELEKRIMGCSCEFDDRAGVAILYPLHLMQVIEKLGPSLNLRGEYSHDPAFKIYVVERKFWSRGETTLLTLRTLPGSLARCALEINPGAKHKDLVRRAVSALNVERGLPENEGYCLKPVDGASYRFLSDGEAFIPQTA
jgi:hypothetical protein